MGKLAEEQKEKRKKRIRRTKYEGEEEKRR